MRKIMNPDEQRIAIAEWCGWVQREVSHGVMIRWHSKEWFPPNGEDYSDLPDYLNDLNAMHEAESKLDASGQICERNIYGQALRDLVHPEPYLCLHWLEWCLAHATAAQRAEALLRTIGKWKNA